MTHHIEKYGALMFSGVSSIHYIAITDLKFCGDMDP